MKRILILILWLLFVLPCQSQEFFDFNKGGIEEESYYSVIHYTNVGGYVIVEVEIGEKKYKFIVDTGASAALTQSTFDELNIKKSSKTKISDSTSKTDSLTTVIVPDIKIGDLNVVNIPAIILPANIIFDCLKIDGIIGSNMLRNSIIKFSSKDSTLTITNSPTKLNLKRMESTRIELLANYSSQPTIWIKVKNKKSGKEQLLFDSGMMGLYQMSLTHFKYFNHKGLLKDVIQSKGGNNIGIYGNENDTLTYFARIPEIQICKTEFKNISFRTTPGLERIGAKLFDYGIVTVDFINKRFYFESYEKSYDVLYKEFPFDLKVENGKLLVATVWNENLKKQMEPGDQIIKIDGIDYEHVDSCKVFNNFKIKDIDVLIIRSADGCEKTITLKSDMRI